MTIASQITVFSIGVILKKQPRGSFATATPNLAPFDEIASAKVTVPASLPFAPAQRHLSLL